MDVRGDGNDGWAVVGEKPKIAEHRKLYMLPVHQAQAISNRTDAAIQCPLASLGGLWHQGCDGRRPFPTSAPRTLAAGCNGHPAIRGLEPRI